ncbi:MAG: amidohydrolase family protein [Acidobacteria bacterium]|nr:amidohydrolase family protein [Acidobacteriota bacterium]
MNVRLYILVRLGFALALLAAPLAAQETYDVLIRNGRIVDGAGNPWYRGDVAIRGDRIAAMGHLPDATAAKTIDAGGQIVAPGFVDIHNHSRGRLLDVPDAENFIRQGVTTIVEGNDGSSPLPLAPFFEKFRRTRVALNYASFVGHGSVRHEVIGDDDRLATPEELDRMRALVREAMQQGAFGLSTGLFYLPGVFAPTEEVVELAKVAAEYGGMHISHMRDETEGLLDSVAETIRIGEEGGLPTQVTHHKAIGVPAHGRSAETLALIEAARVRGVDVSVDQYPYTASHTGLTALFPGWAQEGGRGAMLERFVAPETRERIRAEVARRIEHDRGGGDAANVQFSNCAFDPSLNGRTLADATRDAGREPDFLNAAETAIEIVEKGSCQAIYHAMKEADVERIMAYPGTMIASDGGVVDFGEGVPHPRYYGTFPRVLGRYTREKGLLRLEDAVRKMTSLPAGRLGLWDRGLLRPGMMADVVILDDGAILDTSEFGDSHRYAVGVEVVIVNGLAVLDGGAMTGERPGRVLLGPGAGKP